MKLSRKWDRRKGVAGILSALLFFVLLFTVGFGFYQAATSDQTASVNAYSQRLSLQAQASQENLTLKAGSGAANGVDYLWLMINNTGGTDSTVKSVYVSSLSGGLLSHSSSTGSPFLSTSSDLSQSLPVTLDPGASTSAIGGNIQILPSALPECEVITSTGCEGQTVYVSVLTKLGNVFSVSFPPLSTGTVKNLLVNQGLVEEYLVTQSVMSLTTQVVAGGCVACVNGSYAGGNILVVLLTAKPSPVQQGGTITVNATVANYSPYSASSVTVTLYATYTGTATVTPNIAGGSPYYACGSISAIASGGSKFVLCTFTANAGNLGGGTVTFIGEATACIATGTGTSSPCSVSAPGTPATSSVASSNPVQVGAFVSYGLWQPNFYIYYFTGCSPSGSCQASPSCWKITQDCGAGVIPDSEKYVAIYVQVMNIASTPLTLLDGSYIQSVSENVEFDLFMGCSASVCDFTGQTYGASYATSSATFAAYGCTDSAPSAPQGQNCLTVSQGQSVILMFVATYPGSSAWTCQQMGSSPCGGTGGQQSAILLDFAACISTPSVCSSGQGTYAATSQQIPFEGVVVH